MKIKGFRTCHAAGRLPGPSIWETGRDRPWGRHVPTNDPDWDSDLWADSDWPGNSCYSERGELASRLRRIYNHGLNQ